MINIHISLSTNTLFKKYVIFIFLFSPQRCYSPTPKTCKQNIRKNQNQASNIQKTITSQNNHNNKIQHFKQTEQQIKECLIFFT